MITVYTVTYNEEFHIQFMINHYRKNFPNCHIVVYDNHSDDDTVKIALNNNAEVIFFDSNNRLDDLKHIEIKNNCWKAAKTDWVLTCDMDELLDINEDKLKFEESQNTSLIKSEGYNMVNLEGYNTLETIQYGDRATQYDKPYLFNKKLIKEINYTIGCHTGNPIGNVKISERAYKAYHYRFINKELLRRRYISYSKRLSDENLKQGWGRHYLKTEEELMMEFDDLRNKAIKLL